MVGGAGTVDPEYVVGWISPRTIDIEGSGCAIGCANDSRLAPIDLYGWMWTTGRPASMVSRS
jgi:hypothetical protein